jgi:putative glutathione S-transferase
MGQLIDGEWHKGWYDPDKKGAFQRPDAVFRDRVSADGSTGLAAERGRYHLYVSYACPWAHRTLIVRALRGLEAAIGVTIVEPKMSDEGWSFGADADPIGPATYLRDVYLRANPRYSGRVTVPVLWDKSRSTIVSNESREIMRMLDTAFDAFATNPTSLAPAALVPSIDEAITANYGSINNGVYRAGFATEQAAYEDACRTLFAALDRNEALLGRQPYLCGDTLTEADVALFTTLLRFDVVYYAHFKCNLKRIADYPCLSAYLHRLHAIPAIRTTCRLDHIKTHYYWSQTTVNPHRIVPLGPDVSAFDAPLAERAHPAVITRFRGLSVASKASRTSARRPAAASEQARSVATHTSMSRPSISRGTSQRRRRS